MTSSPATSALAAFGGPLVLAGAGKMGSAMLTGWLDRGLKASAITVIEPHPAPEITDLVRQHGLTLNPPAVPAARVLVIALKPQSFAEAAPQLQRMVAPDTLVVSIMAGITIAALTAACGGAVVRAMPNTPAAIGRGITVAVPAAAVSAAQRDLTDALLRAIGSVEWVGDETLMDAVTALSGSGPAYVFLLAEEMEKAGIAAGLPPALAATLARETVCGAGELLHRSDQQPAVLRKNVTSPGGTTAAALDVMMAPHAFPKIVTEAIAAATRRSRELAR